MTSGIQVCFCGGGGGTVWAEHVTPSCMHFHGIWCATQEAAPCRHHTALLVWLVLMARDLGVAVVGTASVAAVRELVHVHTYMHLKSYMAVPRLCTISRTCAHARSLAAATLCRVWIR